MRCNCKYDGNRVWLHKCHLGEMGCCSLGPSDLLDSIKHLMGMKLHACLIRYLRWEPNETVSLPSVFLLVANFSLICIICASRWFIQRGGWERVWTLSRAAQQQDLLIFLWINPGTAITTWLWTKRNFNQLTLLVILFWIHCYCGSIRCCHAEFTFRLGHQKSS